MMRKLPLRPEATCPRGLALLQWGTTWPLPAAVGLHRTIEDEASSLGPEGGLPHLLGPGGGEGGMGGRGKSLFPGFGVGGSGGGACPAQRELPMDRP